MVLGGDRGNGNFRGWGGERWGRESGGEELVGSAI